MKTANFFRFINLLMLVLALGACERSTETTEVTSAKPATTASPDQEDQRLAYEGGLYEGMPMRNFGRLAEEMKRAVQLVVDTGMHAKQWQLGLNTCMGKLTKPCA